MIHLKETGCGGVIPGLVKWDLWWTKLRLGGFSPSTSVSPANLHSTKFSITIVTRGRPISGRRAEWTQLDSTPPLSELKKNGHRDNIKTNLQKIKSDYVK
jgi:hypothetical protein